MSANQLPLKVNIKTMLAQPPVALEFVLPGFVCATVGALVSPGGVGKSFWSLALAIAISGGPKADLTGLKPKDGRVLVLSKEDPIEVVSQRVHAINQALPKSVSYQGLDYRSCVGIDIDIMNSVWFDQICAAANGTRLVILDTLTRFHNLDENSAQDMKSLLAQLESLAQQSGAAVLFLHHTSKSSAMNGQNALQQAARGSSVLIDNARWAAFLAVMTEQEARQFGIPLTERDAYVRWNISKQNYGAAHPDVWFRRGEGGVLIPTAFTAIHQTQLNSRRKKQRGLPEASTTSAVPEIPTLPSATGAFQGKW